MRRKVKSNVNVKRKAYLKIKVQVGTYVGMSNESEFENKHHLM